MRSVTPDRPLFSELTAAESRAILRRNHVGRLCFLNRGVVDIQPVHYVVRGEWIFLRSANGTKLEAFAHNPYVAFEVDEIADTFDWRSVIARGTIYFLSEDGARFERLAFERAVRALRSFIPDSLTDLDPTPFRQTVYGIHIDLLTGRRAEPSARRSKRRSLPRPTRPVKRVRSRNGT